MGGHYLTRVGLESWGSQRLSLIENCLFFSTQLSHGAEEQLEELGGVGGRSAGREPALSGARDGKARSVGGSALAKLRERLLRETRG